MKHPVLSAVVGVAVAFLLAGCAMDRLTGADVSELDQQILAKEEILPPAPAPVVTAAPLVAGKKCEVGAIEV